MGKVYLDENDDRETLLNHRQLLAEGIVDIATRLKIISPDAVPNGPEVLMLVEDILGDISDPRDHLSKITE